LLRWRLLLGLILIGLLAGLCWLDYHAARPCTFLLPLAIVLGVLASGELLWLFAAKEIAPIPTVLYGGNLLIIGSNGIPLFWGAEPRSDLERLAWPVLALALAMLWAFRAEMGRYQKPGRSTINLAATLFAFCYVGILVSFLVQLRVLGGNRSGMIALTALVATVKMGDTGAYTVGRLLGRHKLAPTLSPGKTIEGAVGGILFACLGAYSVLVELRAQLLESAAPSIPWWVWITFGVLVGIAGILGDLAESMLKRDLGRKDSSPWMPGFGGVLDIVDSLLMAGPVAFACIWAQKGFR
jgi:phosphatidate cytidylyltransferase